MKTAILLSFLATLALVAAEGPIVAPYHPAPPPPPYHPAPAPYHPAPAPYHPAPAYKEEPAVYNYAYGVEDSYAGLNFGHSEGRDGYATKGEYHVALPDGRIQTVVYHVADDYSGYVADVSYSGEVHPYAPAPYAPKPYAPAPYAPAPYKPAPYVPAPAPYVPAPAPYVPAPAPYHA